MDNQLYFFYVDEMSGNVYLPFIIKKLKSNKKPQYKNQMQRIKKYYFNKIFFFNPLNLFIQYFYINLQNACHML